MSNSIGMSFIAIAAVAQGPLSSLATRFALRSDRAELRADHATHEADHREHRLDHRAFRRGLRRF